MGRYARQTIANTPYHIINRGNNHQPVFYCDDDHRSFIDALETAKEKYPCRIYSFVLMTNHVHLLLEAVEDGKNLAHFMKHITQRHGQYINKRYGRSGTLWEGRFKSSPVSSDRYLMACSRYIEMNPVRAGIVKDPADFHYSSYGAKVGLKKLKLLDFDPLYLGLGTTEEDRQKRYQRWLHESIHQDEWQRIREAIQRNWVFGNNKFKEDIENRLGRKFEIKKAGRRPKM